MIDNDETSESAEGRVPPPTTDATDDSWPFGPMFFFEQLHSFVRDRCPSPGEHLPAVEVHLIDGEVLEVCHVMGLSPMWVALAVMDIESSAQEPPPMRTELVPYQMVSRITVRATRKETIQLGFELNKKPVMWAGADTGLLSPEDALRKAAGRLTSRKVGDHRAGKKRSPRKSQRS